MDVVDVIHLERPLEAEEERTEKQKRKEEKNRSTSAVDHKILAVPRSFLFALAESADWRLTKGVSGKGRKRGDDKREKRKRQKRKKKTRKKNASTAERRKKRGRREVHGQPENFFSTEQKGQIWRLSS